MVDSKDRDEILAYTRRMLMGPVHGESETIEGTPFLRYMTGILFPQGTSVRAATDAVAATAEEASDDVSVPSPADGESTGEAGGIASGIDLASERLPSAVGISFKVRDNSVVRCHVWAARYENEPGTASDRGKAVWRRLPLHSEGSPATVEITKGVQPVQVFDGRARIEARWRTNAAEGTAIVTVALVNEQHAAEGAPDPALALFQVGMRCEADSGMQAYPRTGNNHPKESEESEVELLYACNLSFARGHGAAADWSRPEAGLVRSVSVDFLPSADVPMATFEVDDPTIDTRSCEIKFLVQAPREDVLRVLGTLTQGYAAWAARQREEARQSDDPAVAARLVQRIEAWARRMQAGLDRLRSDDAAWQCFVWANEAMGAQMVLAKSRPKVPFPRALRKAMPEIDLAGRCWRSFQIAFLLGVLESLMDDVPDREVVDVIWFPTGGGKTEAYLFVSAFELLRRRLVHRDADTGTAIISRYTMRFLTAQQFQRTAALIVALESVRKKSQRELGTRPFTLGLWVGSAVTPNTSEEASKRLDALLDGAERDEGAGNPFLLEACPCCGTELIPARKEPHEKWTRADVGARTEDGKFILHCTSESCHFKDRLPLSVVDDVLYQDPPSILIATIDKFAALPWNDRARTFFGGPDDKSPPPSLILQDELHLISGPLGSIAAPYDAAIATIIKRRGRPAKIIGSTATIRNAREQVRSLYGRETAVFPGPSGRWDNAYFFRTDHTRPGRTYLGVMGQGYIKPVVAMVWTAAALLQSTTELRLQPESLDAYWSLIAYHNSRRELGRTLTAAQDEIPARIKAIASRPARVRRLGEPMELSATMVRSLGRAIQALEMPYETTRPPVDFVPCTSILSVGVDVTRLGIMLMNGQPKLTSEYIQATSRVGRGKVPGLVVSLFSAAKPRDRSHYEDFKPYHESLYRNVEPTSLTGYALPARERTLHAALIAVMRHATRLSKNESARNFDCHDEMVARCVADLLAAMRAADALESDDVKILMEQRLSEWEAEVKSSDSLLLYEARGAGTQFAALLADHGKAAEGGLWPTMRSMRNVDDEVRVGIDRSSE